MNLLKIAVEELGVKETHGPEHSPRILEYAREAGFDWVADDETPWCSIFVNWCCLKANLMRSKRADARSWLSVGKPVDDPIPGDIVIFWRESPSSWKGHVGLFMGFSQGGSKVFCLGGNQRDSVSIQGYPASTVLGFRRLIESISIPPFPLQIGDRSADVVKLQLLLRELNFDPGSPDGVFGPKTAHALTGLQASLNLKGDGLYSKEVHDHVQKIFLSQA